jgi:hypothetical protein
MIAGENPVRCWLLPVVRMVHGESRTFELVRKMDGNFHPKLNMGSRSIAHKYREGKVKRTLKRELKVPEIAERQVFGTNCGRVVKARTTPT